ncbi:hypothetical protein BCV70DRAFT_201778 [Testicularia cyperi]|uniref:uS12 prolyl 3,4-dihydroxylase n=1 Tax=Testicularia cyperi TaxID=1882483 RepID=A0A317XKV9_9BASI|nr:hypothetical protein BCV70DRAFT_201778 [Testicularia cyperi]
MTVSKVEASFSPNLLAPETVQDFNKQYEASGPYKHAVVPELINDELLKATRNEIIQELRFAEKETDIYKVNQTGDLANLDGLPEEEAGRLQSLLQVRNAIYSEEFRSWLQGVTGCGPLSAKKKDMSINDYRQGCHLLNHDDVISTRRVSYILYLPDPEQPWQPEWGGALELYPVKTKGTPDDIPSKIIPPKWNQFTFFTVQPGHSFHSVEEVVSPSQSRLSISGWFHRPQEGEPGFTTEDEKKEAEVEKEMSSLESLSAQENAKLTEPYPESSEPPLPGSPLSQDEKRFLIQFLNPAYLTEKTQEQLFEQFGDDSHILLSDILRKEIAQPIEKALRDADQRDGFQWWRSGKGESSTRIQSHGVGTDRAEKADDEASRWTIAGPPHKQRYAVLADQKTPAKADEVSKTKVPSPLPTSASELMRLVSEVLFPSLPFRHFLANVSQMVPLGARPIEARRFRPGLDYTLARSDTEPVLDVTLNLTPDVVKPSLDEERKGGPKGLAGKAKKAKTASSSSSSSSSSLLNKKEAKDLQAKWESGDIGGWECYMAPHEGEEDPAVYQSGHSGKKKPQDGATDGENANDNEEEEEEEEEIVEMIPDDGEDDDEDEDFDGVLLNLTPTFNTLSIVLRDEGVMRFVKYLAAGAGGSRWDVIGEFEIGAIEEEDEEMDQDDA